MTLAWLRYDGAVWYLLLAIAALVHCAYRIGYSTGYARLAGEWEEWLRTDMAEMRARLGLDKPEVKKDVRLH